MKIRADIKCHTCGFVSGEVIGEAIGPQTSQIRPDRIVPSPLCPRPWPVAGKPLRCARCGGHVYLDDIDHVREQRAAA